MKTSFISKKPISKGESILGADIRAGIFDLIQTNHPGFTVDSYISLEELNLY